MNGVDEMVEKPVLLRSEFDAKPRMEKIQFQRETDGQVDIKLRLILFSSPRVLMGIQAKRTEPQSFLFDIIQKNRILHFDILRIKMALKP